ncbi:MAG: hypothetical protein MOB07_13880 [Acidobacteria bacterium]|nr:hypothetical protein [Acidobacteriota bacterium]
MREAILSYFMAEKYGAMILLFAGLATIGTAIALVATRSSYRGMAAPLALFALIEVGIGGGVWARTDGQVAGLLDEFSRAPSAMVRGELSRMGPVMRNFEIVKIVEIAVFALGVTLAYACRRNDFAFAAGVGCVLQASLPLVFDLIAARRAEVYVEVLRDLLS